MPLSTAGQGFIEVGTRREAHFGNSGIRVMVIWNGIRWVIDGSSLKGFTPKKPSLHSLKKKYKEYATS